LFFYFVAGIVASFCHAFVSLTLLGEPGVPALGASGAISGVVLLFALMFPKERILVFGLIPVPAFWGAVAFVGLDAWGLLLQTQGRGFPIGYGSHLGGALFGLVYFLIVVRRGRARRGF
jgi:membrane associated rhomboid family serine protease